MRIGIIGGGITGLTTALALRKTGLPSTIYEQAKELNEIGAGILLQPNALKVFDWLGISDEIKRQGVALDKLEITNPHLQTIRKIKSQEAHATVNNNTIAIHRARLQNILYHEVVNSAPVKLNKIYLGHTVHDNRINLQFQNGDEEVDLLFGADGIHSTARKILFPESVLRNSGQVCWRGVSTMTLPGTLANCGIEAWGRQIRFGFSPIADDEVYWYAVAKEGHQARAENIDLKDYLIHLYRDFSPEISAILANTEASSVHQAILCDLKILPSWHKGRVCLLGDAAHATTPNMGQGACQGIEDAYYISNLLSQSSQHPERAFTLFEQKRRKKVNHIVRTSWRFGKLVHSEIGQLILKLIFKLTPERVMRAQMRMLNSLDPLK